MKPKNGIINGPEGPTPVGHESVNNTQRPGGADVMAIPNHVGPSGAFHVGHLDSMGYRPWLTMSAPSGE